MKRAVWLTHEELIEAVNRALEDRSLPPIEGPVMLFQQDGPNDNQRWSLKKYVVFVESEEQTITLPDA